MIAVAFLKLGGADFLAPKLSKRLKAGAVVGVTSSFVR
jgi:hypothetical protein